MKRQSLKRNRQSTDPEILELSGYTEKEKAKGKNPSVDPEGAAIEADCKDTKYLTEAEFYQLMDELLHDPACKFCDVVHEIVRGRAETAEAKERELRRRGSTIKGDAAR